MAKKETRFGAAIRLRFMPEHSELVRQVSKDAGLTISGWIRDRVVKAAKAEAKGLR